MSSNTTHQWLDGTGVQVATTTKKYYLLSNLEGVVTRFRDSFHAIQVSGQIIQYRMCLYSATNMPTAVILTLWRSDSVVWTHSMVYADASVSNTQRIWDLSLENLQVQKGDQLGFELVGGAADTRIFTLTGHGVADTGVGEFEHDDGADGGWTTISNESLRHEWVIEDSPTRLSPGYENLSGGDSAFLPICNDGLYYVSLQDVVVEDGDTLNLIF